MVSLPKVKVTRKLYIFKEGGLSYSQDAKVEVETHLEEAAWDKAITNAGFSGGSFSRPVNMKTLGGLSARVYRRESSGQRTDKDNIFTEYDFLIDIDATYIVMVEDVIAFFDFSRRYLVQPQPNVDDLSDLSNVKDALWEISGNLAGIDGVLGIIKDLLKPQGNVRRQH